MQRLMLSLVCIGVLGLSVILMRVWPVAPRKPSVKLPAGVSLAEALHGGNMEAPKGWHTNIYCQAGQTRSRKVREHIVYLIASFRYKILEYRRSLLLAPAQPTVDFVTPRLGECFHTSGEKYLFAKEFDWEVGGLSQGAGGDRTFLGFVWGGTNQARNAQERVALIESGILSSGIFGMRMSWSLPGQNRFGKVEYLSTNRCAIIRDTRGLVKIVPLNHLKAYSDAGLVQLSDGH